MLKDDKYALAIDAGGTYFKSAVINSNGLMVGASVKKTSVDSSDNSENILGAYETIINEAFLFARTKDIRLSGIGISTPGPFDYIGYKSLMKHKFASIFGMNMKDEFIKRCHISMDLPVKFLHDVHAFVFGEHWKGAAKGYSRVAAVTIGTGIGFGCMIDNRIKSNSEGGPYVSLYGLPYGEGILEDYVSGRGIIRTYSRLAGVDEDSGMNAKEIGLLAESGTDQHAILVYRGVGRILAKVLSDILEELDIECLVLGGQISRSFTVMEEELKNGLSHIKSLKRICMAEHIDLSPLLGAARVVLEEDTG